MSGRPWLLAATGAALDVAVAALLFAFGFTIMGAFMTAVAVASIVMAVVMWRRMR